VVADILFLLSGGNRMWYDFAFWAAVFGVIAALAAALPGFVDYFAVAVKTDARGMATAHMLLNLTTVVLFAVSILLRLDDAALTGGRFTPAFLLSLIGIGLLTVSGWLGGEMAFRHHLGMVPDTTAEEDTEERHHRLDRAA
jgi:uncharacterized membrane protein